MRSPFETLVRGVFALLGFGVLIWVIGYWLIHGFN